MSMNIPYGMYPQYSATDLGNDFMAQQYLALQQNPAYAQMFTGQQPPQVDTFEQQGGSSIGNGLSLGLIGGGGAATGMWFLGTNPIKDGKISEGMIKAYDKVKVAEAKDAALKTLLNDPKYRDNALKADKEAQRIANKSSIAYQKERLTKLQGVETKIKTLADDASKADISKFIKENAESFGLKGEEAAITKNAEKLAGKFDTKAKLLTQYEKKIAARTANVSRLTTAAESTIGANFKDGKLIENAEKSIVKAVKNFKWTKVAKAGGIGAVAGLVLGCIFG